MNGRLRSQFWLIKTIAFWEFSRWFKWKDQLITLALSALISLILFGGQSLLGLFSGSIFNIVIVGGSSIGLDETSAGNIIFIHADSGAVDAHRKAVHENRIDGLIIFQNRDSAELWVNSEPAWLPIVERKFNESRMYDFLQRSHLSAGFMDELNKPVDIKVSYTGNVVTRITTGEKVAAGIFIGLMLLGIFIGLAYQFIAVTGEKQVRITEVIVSAVSPQTWIDGKIVGISILSFVLLITYSAAAFLFIMISNLFGTGLSVPVAFYNPGLVLLLSAFSLTGFLLWNTIFTAFAATISDPNTSSRGAIMFLPVIPTVLAIMGLKAPDSLLMMFMSLFPLTSAPAISLRLVLVSVPSWEIVLSLALSVLAILFFRKSAGLIFSLSMLMYGKEPSWREMLIWLKTMKKRSEKE